MVHRMSTDIPDAFLARGPMETVSIGYSDDIPDALANTELMNGIVAGRPVQYQAAQRSEDSTVRAAVRLGLHVEASAETYRAMLQRPGLME